MTTKRDEKTKGKCHRKSDMMKKLFHSTLIVLLFFSFFDVQPIHAKKQFKV
ncbi:hypothetical protein P4478_23375, partial [Bacillus subtilis]|nr:hypothetical protein [Bacillus subtilis]